MPSDEPTASNHLEPDERDPEASPADAAEQSTPANPMRDPDDVHLSSEVDEFDALEQSRVVDVDEDYRDEHPDESR